MIRKALITDIEAITNIYNESVLTTTASMDIEPATLNERKNWFLDHTEKQPIIIYELEEKGIVGWASISAWSQKKGYSLTAEVSVYVLKQEHGKGLGKKLLLALIQKAQELEYHSLVARIASDNTISLKLHEQLGFKEIGLMKEFGFKFGRFVDIIIMQKFLSKN